jgi:hypothetical protein
MALMTVGGIVSMVGVSAATCTNSTPGCSDTYYPYFTVVSSTNGGPVSPSFAPGSNNGTCPYYSNFLAAYPVAAPCHNASAGPACISTATTIVFVPSVSIVSVIISSISCCSSGTTLTCDAVCRGLLTGSTTGSPSGTSSGSDYCNCVSCCCVCCGGCSPNCTSGE